MGGGLIGGIIYEALGQSSGFALTVGSIGMPTFVILFVLYFILMWNRVGYTVGMRICRIRVINKDGGHPTIVRGIVRWMTGYLPYILMMFITYPVAWPMFMRELLGTGFLIALCIMIGVDKKKQGWHDKAAGTFVVRTVQRQTANSRTSATESQDV